MEISMRKADDSEARGREISEKEEGKRMCSVAAARLADAQRVMGTRLCRSQERLLTHAGQVMENSEETAGSRERIHGKFWVRRLLIHIGWMMEDFDDEGARLQAGRKER